MAIIKLLQTHGKSEGNNNNNNKKAQGKKNHKGGFLRIILLKVHV